MKIFLIIMAFVLPVSLGYANIPVQLNQNAKPIRFSGENVMFFSCNGNINKKLLDTLYVLSKKYALNNSVNLPSRKICEISITNIKNSFFTGVTFYEKKPSTSADGVTEGVSTNFNINKFEKNDAIWMVIFDSGRQVGNGICINSIGNEIDNTYC